MNHIKNSVVKFLKKTKIGVKTEESFIMENWTKIVGKNIAKNTVPFKISRKKLFIYVENSVIMNELIYEKTRIKTEVNRIFRQEKVKEIVFRIRQ